MSNNVKKEYELYPEMRKWLNIHLTERYKSEVCKVVVIDSHSFYLDSVLERYKIIDYYPTIGGLKIKIDILGMVIWKNKAKLYFVEAKKTAFNLQDIGQLLIYCKLCNPEEAYLLSSVGLGSIKNVLYNFKREDLLDYGDGSIIRKMKVAKWDINRNSIDMHSIIPKL